jgi:hypothetical protein
MIIIEATFGLLHYVDDFNPQKDHDIHYLQKTVAKRSKKREAKRKQEKINQMKK